MSEKVRYKWHHARLWFYLFFYWLITIGVAGILARSPKFQSLELGWVIIAMLLSVCICMATERGEWRIWQRIGFIPVAWFLHPLLMIPFQFSIGLLLYKLGRFHLIDRSTAFWGSLPIVIFAMRRSRLFVFPQSQARK